MNILIIGSGAREYSIGLALKKDKRVKKIYFAPGNGATNELGENIEINDYHKLTQFAKEAKIDLSIVGPEKPLVDGIVDIFKKEGLLIFGPTKSAARLEASKAFMKSFAMKYNLPTAKYKEFVDINQAKEFIDSLTPPIVIKADGLCAGKGVIITKSKDEAILEANNMLNGKSFGEAGKKIVIEEFLDGFELSVFAICDGDNYIVLSPCQDHKRLLDNDLGPNTGGMGAYTPTPLCDEVLLKKIEDRIIKPTIDGMKKEGSPFCGVLFCGLMIVKNEPYLLEFNVRFGDPECEVLMPLYEDNLLDILLASINGNISSIKVSIPNRYTVGVVIASKEYPYSNSKPAMISINSSMIPKDAHISYAGVSLIDNRLYATGGRVLVCVATDKNLKDAKDKAYKLCEAVSFDGMQYRKDIANRALK